MEISEKELKPQSMFRAWAKRRTGQPMQFIETLAADWIAEHPKYS